eukprot:m51a1_g3462 hypothetical protein (550) ;mRNA; r:707961-718965
MPSQAPVPSPAPKKKKKKVSTGHTKELPPSMSLNQINAQYKFGEVTNISFGDIFGHVFERVIGVQAVAQQYMAAKKHGHSTMFEQEIPIIHYGSGSNASYLQLDHNHRIISILFIHVMEHYNFQLPAISDAMAAFSSFWRMLCLIPIHVTVYRSTMPVPLIMYFGKAINEITTATRHETWIDQLLYNIALRECSFLSHTRIKENFFAKFMNAIDRIDPSILTLINNNLMAPTPHPCFHSHTNLTNLSFLYLSTACQMTCLKYIFSDNSTDITTNSALTDLIDHWEQHFTKPLSWKELTDKPFKMAGMQKKNTVISIPYGAVRHPVVLTARQHFYINYILRNCKGTINFPLLQHYRQATTPMVRQDYDDAVVQASIIAISTLTRNRVIPTTEEAVQARTDCLEVIYFTTLFWDPTENTMQNVTMSLTAVAAEVRRLSRLSARGRAMDGPKAMLNAVRSIKDKIKGAKQASKETSSASGDEAESSSSESIDELRGKKVVECNVDDDQEEHKEKTTTCKRTREESNEEYQQDQIIKGLEAARAKLKEKIAMY